MAAKLRVRKPELPPDHLDLLRLPLINRFFRHRAYPLAFQILFASLFAMIVYFAFFGVGRGSKNPATLLTWGLWWPLLPVSLVLLGRAWCAVCPLAAGVSALQSIANPQRAPPPSLIKAGPWLMGFTFLSLTWSDRVWGFTVSPVATGVIVIVLLTGALCTGLIFQRRTWCRSLCPIGALTGLYATSAVVELRGRPHSCQRCKSPDCYTGNQQAQGCPLFEFPKTMDSNRNCNLCGNCLKSCPHRSPRLALRAPARELWQLRKPLLGEAWLAILLVAIVLFQTVDMTTAWGEYMKMAMTSTGLTNYNLMLTVTFMALMALIPGLYLLTASISSRFHGTGIKVNSATFGYAYIPLALSGHLGHNMSHLWQEAPVALQTALGQMGLPLSPPAVVTEPAVTSAHPLAIIFLLLGIAGSFYVVWKIAASKSTGRSTMVPHLIFLSMMAATYLFIFLLPMNPRHGH